MLSRLSSVFTDTANAIRAKGGTSAFIKAVDMPSAISRITTPAEGIWKAIIEGNSYVISGDLGKSITVVGSSAFMWDLNLTYVSIPNCTEVQRYAFCSCASLSEVYMPEVKTLSARAFFGTAITNFSCPKVETVYGSPFNSIVSFISLPALKSFDCLFSNCSALTSFKIPSFSYVPSSMFYYCKSLSSVDTSLIESIGDYGFYQCTALTSLSFPRCSSIGNYGLAFCSNLSSLSLPNCAFIGNSVFAGCVNLSTLYLPKCTSIGAYGLWRIPAPVVSLPALEDASHVSWMFSSCSTTLKEVYLPKLLKVGSGIFSSCMSLSSVNVDSLEEAGNYMFYRCIKLQSVNLPKLKSLPYYAFASCSSLTTVSLGAASTIASMAFAYCPILKSVYLMSTSVCAGSTDMFSSSYTYGSSSSDVRIYVPSSLYEAYLTAPYWSSMSTKFISI